VVRQVNRVKRVRVRRKRIRAIVERPGRGLDLYLAFGGGQGRMGRRKVRTAELVRC
jgi:hypothetical protein